MNIKNIEIKIKDIPHLAKVQERLFELGAEWQNSGKTPYKYIMQDYIAVDSYGKIVWSDYMSNGRHLVKLEDILEKVTIDEY